LPADKGSVLFKNQGEIKMSSTPQNTQSAAPAEIDSRSTYERWFAKQIQEGINAVKNGEVVSHEEAKERIRGLGVKIK